MILKHLPCWIGKLLSLIQIQLLCLLKTLTKDICLHFQSQLLSAWLRLRPASAVVCPCSLRLLFTFWQSAVVCPFSLRVGAVFYASVLKLKLLQLMGSTRMERHTESKQASISCQRLLSTNGNPSLSLWPLFSAKSCISNKKQEEKSRPF